MFERFNDQALQVVDLAREEAVAMRAQRISPVHFLVALTRPDGPAKNVLASLGITTGSAREAVVGLFGPGTALHDGDIPFTPQSQTLMSHAANVRRKLGDRLAGPEHLLFAITMLEPITEQLYRALGVTPPQVQDALCSMIESFDGYTPAAAREAMARIGSPAPAEVYIVRATDDEASLHLDYDQAVQAAGDSGSVTVGRVTLRQGEFFSIRDHSYVRDDLRYLDYAIARDTAESADAHVCVMIPFTRDVKAVTAGGSEVVVGSTTEWSAASVERRVTVLGQ
jgi:hypothetical protein